MPFLHFSPEEFFEVHVDGSDIVEKVDVGVLFLETVQGCQCFQVSVESIKIATALWEMGQGSVLPVLRHDLDQFAAFASEVVCQQAFDLDQ